MSRLKFDIPVKTERSRLILSILSYGIFSINGSDAMRVEALYFAHLVSG